MPQLTLVEAVRQALDEEMARDESVIVMGEDVGVHGGVFRATDGLHKKYGEHRVIDTPLAELGIAGVAIGAAMNGMRPVAEMQFADYIHPAYDQIVNEAAKIRYRSNGGFSCPVVFRAPFGAGVHGGLYHSQSVESLFFHVPGLKIVVPSTPYDCKGLLKSAIRDEDPVLFFEHKKNYRRFREDVPDGEYVQPIGVARLDREGSDCSIVTYGVGVYWAREAADQLDADEVSVEILDLRTLLPLDADAIKETVAKTSKVLILHEDNKTGGIGAEIAARSSGASVRRSRTSTEMPSRSTRTAASSARWTPTPYVTTVTSEPSRLTAARPSGIVTSPSGTSPRIRR